MSATAEKPALVGGWTAFHPLTPEDMKVFEEAMHGFVGVLYTPLEVSTQVVNGVNYRYKCNASMPPSEVVWQALVDIYQPIDGKPYVTAITRI
ncbi:MAG: hypothetical protein ACOVRK_10425 [Chryseobacterium taeanense]|jgi:hypothetical protein